MNCRIVGDDGRASASEAEHPHGCIKPEQKIDRIELNCQMSKIKDRRQKLAKVKGYLGV